MTSLRERWMILSIDVSLNLFGTRFLFGRTIVNNYGSVGSASFVSFSVYGLETFEGWLFQCPYFRRERLWRIASGLRWSFYCDRHGRG